MLIITKDKKDGSTRKANNVSSEGSGEMKDDSKKKKKKIKYQKRSLTVNFCIKWKTKL